MYHGVNRRRYVQVLGLGGVVSAAGCLGDSEAADASGTGGDVTLATGTTAYDSGLLGELTPGFEATFGTTVDTVARGTAGSLRTARNGDCDIVLVHARPLEDAFLRDGYGVNRRTVMVNDFLIVGPPDDPADVAGEGPVVAFRAIATANATFLSRGDRSGTHIRERRIWNEAGVEPSGEWYRETGQGMGNTLVTAERIGAYTLTDRGSFLTVSDEGGVVPHVDRGLDDPPPLLRNEYAVIPVNPGRHDVAYETAMAYVGYLTGPAGQSRIADFRAAGDRAFRPLGPSAEPEFRQYVPSDWPG
jgi:tungstate transport system substrate-binding protein